MALVLAITLVVAVIGLAVFRSVTRQIGGDPALAMAAMEDVALGRLDTVIPPRARALLAAWPGQHGAVAAQFGQ